MIAEEVYEGIKFKPACFKVFLTKGRIQLNSQSVLSHICDRTENVEFFSAVVTWTQ